MEEQQAPQQKKLTLSNVSLLESNMLKQNVSKMSRDMNFFAIVYVVYGVLMCLTIIGAIIGIPFIIYHMKLREAGQAYEKFSSSNDFFFLNKAIENQQKFFFFYKVFLIIMIVVVILEIIFIAYLFMQGFSGLPTNLT